MAAHALFSPMPFLRSSLVVFLALGAGSLHAATISGHVRADGSNSVLPGMVVEAYGTDGQVAASATTDSTGTYLLGFSAGGQFRVLAYDNNGVYATAFANGADSYEATPLLTLGATENAKLDFQLQNGVTLSGTVRVSGVPTGGITVAAYNAGSGTRRGTTLSQPTVGTWSIVLPPGTYKLVAYDDGGSLGPLFYGNTIAFDPAPLVTVTAGQAQSGLDFPLLPGVRMSGSVVDSATGNAIAGATVYAYTSDGYPIRSATADIGGQYRLTLAAGSYRFVAADPSGVFAASFPADAETFAKSPSFMYSAGQLPSMTFRLGRAGILRGRMTDANGAALPSLHIAAYNPDGTPRTDTQADNSGAFTLSLPPGSFRIAAYDTSLAYATQFYRLANDFSNAIPLTTAAGLITNGVDFTMARAGHVAGTVTDAVGSVPLAGITVAAYDATFGLTGSAVTNAAGQYTLAVPAGTFRVVAWDAALLFATSYDGGAANFETTAPRTIAADAQQTVNFTMHRGTIVTGRVLTANLVPVPGIEVDALDVEGHHVATGVSRDDGSFGIPLLPASYKFFIRDPQRRYSAAFYGATDLSGATVINVLSTGSPASLIITLSESSRRRSARH